MSMTVIEKAENKCAWDIAGWAAIGYLGCNFFTKINPAVGFISGVTAKVVDLAFGKTIQNHFNSRGQNFAGAFLRIGIDALGAVAGCSIAGYQVSLGTVLSAGAAAVAANLAIMAAVILACAATSLVIASIN